MNNDKQLIGYKSLITDFKDYHNLFNLGLKIDHEINSKSGIDYTNVITLMKKYRDIYNSLEYFLKIKYLLILKMKMFRLHFLIINSTKNEGYFEENFKETYNMNVVIGKYMRTIIKNRDIKEKLICANLIDPNDVTNTDYKWDVPSAFILSNFDNTITNNIQKDNKNNKYAIVVDNGEIPSITEFSDIRKTVVKFPQNLDNIFIVKGNLNITEFNNTYVRLFKAKATISNKMMEEFIVVIETDSSNFIYSLLLIPLDKSFRKSYIMITDDIIETLSEMSNLGGGSDITMITLDINDIINNLNITDFSLSFINNLFHRLNRFSEIDNTILNKLNYIIEVLNGFEEKSKSKNLSEFNCDIFEFRKRSKGPNDNTYKLIKLKKTDSRYTGEGTPHRFHASPRRHIRRGHWRKKGNGERIWINPTIINETNKPTLYKV